VNLYFKFKPDVKPAARVRVLRSVRRTGVLKVTRLFPRAITPELKSFYVVNARHAAELERVRLLLESSNEIIYAQLEVPRSPM
jgi:hypothetical protein